MYYGFLSFFSSGGRKKAVLSGANVKKEGHEVMEAMSYQPGYHDAILLPVPQTAMFLRKIKKNFKKDRWFTAANFQRRR